MARDGAERGHAKKGDTFGAYSFSAYARADPTRIWAALTDSETNGAVLYGLAAYSSWTAHAPIDFRGADGIRVIGQVLCVRPPERLSYLVHACPDDPPTYLTWLLRPAPGGCTIRLQIDDVAAVDSLEEAEDIWLPVIAALQRLVDVS